MLNIPLMSNNITAEDIDVLCDFLKTSDKFTNGPKVREFEQAWANWLGVKYCLFVNSGANANYITIFALKELYKVKEIAVPTLTWSSDIASVYHCGLRPRFFDVDFSTLAMSEEDLLSYLEEDSVFPKVIFLTHILGLCGLTQKLLDKIHETGTILIEDTCESHGAKLKDRKLGTFGLASNFSFYYAHHMSTIEGGMICTDNEDLYETVRMIRSHGMTRECDNSSYRIKYEESFPQLHPEFIFAYPSFNFRSTELNAVIGLNQIKRLDENIEKRRRNFDIFLDNLDSEKYFVDFNRDGNSNYAFTLLLKNKDADLFSKVCKTLNQNNVEYRRGMSGGGNMLRQPFVTQREGDLTAQYPNIDFIHKYGMYLGNYPDLEEWKIMQLCKILNELSR